MFHEAGATVEGLLTWEGAVAVTIIVVIVVVVAIWWDSKKGDGSGDGGAS